jgi:hypothetical protein
MTSKPFRVAEAVLILWKPRVGRITRLTKSRRRIVLCKGHADIVWLHDQGHTPIYDGYDADSDKPKYDRVLVGKCSTIFANCASVSHNSLVEGPRYLDS